MFIVVFLVPVNWLCSKRNPVHAITSIPSHHMQSGSPYHHILIHITSIRYFLQSHQSTPSHHISSTPHPVRQSIPLHLVHIRTGCTSNYIQSITAHHIQSLLSHLILITYSPPGFSITSSPTFHIITYIPHHIRSGSPYNHIQSIHYI